MALKDDLLASLKSELQLTDPDFNEDILVLKIDTAIRKVKAARNYPESYTESMVSSDLEKFYTNIRDIALYEYNKIGADFEDSYNSNGISRTFVNESKLFKGVRPISRL